MTVPRALEPVFVIQNLTGLSGGAERIVVETALAMADRGMRPRIVTFDLREGPCGYDTGDLQVHSVFPWKRGGNAAAPTRPGRGSALKRLAKSVPNVFPINHLKWHMTHGMFERAVRRDLQDNGGDVVIGFLPPAISAAVRAAKALGLPSIASIHNVPDLDFGASPRWDQNPVYRRRTRDALALADRVTVLLPEFAQWFAPGQRDHVVVLPNPVSRLDGLAARPADAQPRRPVILGVGRLTDIKGWDILIAAFAQIAGQIPEWSMRIFGEGPCKTALAQQIRAAGLEGRIALCGLTSAIGAEYDSAAILCHPAAFEGFGLAVAEAMAHGLPPIAFADCAGVSDLITSGADGILVEPGADRTASLAQAVLALATAAAARERLGASAQSITTRFDRTRLLDEWARMIRDVSGTTR